MMRNADEKTPCPFAVDQWWEIISLHSWAAATGYTCSSCHRCIPGDWGTDSHDGTIWACSHHGKMPCQWQSPFRLRSRHWVCVHVVWLYMCPTGPHFKGFQADSGFLCGSYSVGQQSCRLLSVCQCVNMFWCTFKPKVCAWAVCLRAGVCVYFHLISFDIFTQLWVIQICTLWIYPWV